MHEFFGRYRAKVLATDVAESDKLGRIKVEIYPMLIGEDTAIELSKVENVSIEGIAIADLPWAVPASAISVGSGSALGSFAVPDVDAFVWVFFEAGDVNQPVYFAEAPTATVGLPASRLTNYPERRVYKYKKVEIIIDDADGTVIIEVDGDVEITATGNITITGATVNMNP